MTEIDRKGRGRAGEELAARFLELEGYRVLERNRRYAEVEVDLVLRRGSLLVLAEVKLRRNGIQPAADATTRIQRLRLQRAARVLLARHAWAEEIRIDIVGIDWRAGEMRLRHYSSSGVE